ncbi:hypothetical protein HPP92_015171 [Vanilla planifolia]|uniref:GDP-L-galactose phosphorylase 1 n=1 Tax=Vanilla planifolia TaxID=51239 RepID=A0A835QSE4_VANPL|nr:hypothetical protein HPP92_015171 [Vanilla planifolia]
MVSVSRLEGDHAFVKQSTSQEHSKGNEVPPEGFEIPVYVMCHYLENSGALDVFLCKADDEQSLLDTLILAQWEEHAFRGLLNYDVTSCETKIVDGGKRLTAQLNMEWNPNFLKEFEKRIFKLPGGIIKPSYMKNNLEDILCCVTTGEIEKSMVACLAAVPLEGILIVSNANPVEYGHIFLVPYSIQLRTQFIGRTLHLIANIAHEVNSFSFRMFYDYFSATNADQKIYFQACYFANPLPVELLPTLPIYDSSIVDGLSIWELADYSLKALVFTSKDLKHLAAVVGEICFELQKRNAVFNLLITDYGTKMFLFPQVHLPATGRHLHAWECGGYFIYSNNAEFESASESEISRRLASASLDVKGFGTLKQLCCNIASKLC